MSYKPFTAKQRATVAALCEEMRNNADLWIDCEESGAWGALGVTKAAYFREVADKWDVDGGIGDAAQFIRALRDTAKLSRRTQADVFAAIKAYGCTVRKTGYGDEYRVADASELDLAKREEGAAYSAGLADALAIAKHRASLKADATRVAESEAARVNTAIDSGAALVAAIDSAATIADTAAILEALALYAAPIAPAIASKAAARAARLREIAP